MANHTYSRDPISQAGYVNGLADGRRDKAAGGRAHPNKYYIWSDHSPAYRAGYREGWGRGPYHQRPSANPAHPLPPRAANGRFKKRR